MRTESEVAFERSSVCEGNRYVARLHRHQFLVRLEIVVGRKHSGSDQLLLENGNEIQKIFRLAVTYIIYCIGRNGKTVLACGARRGLCHYPQHTLDNVVDVGEVALAVSVIENLYGFSPEQLVRKSEVSHIRTAGRTIHREETQAGGRNVVELGIGVGHQFVALLGSGIEGNRIVNLVVRRVRNLLVRTVNR